MVSSVRLPWSIKSSGGKQSYLGIPSCQRSIHRTSSSHLSRSFLAHDRLLIPLIIRDTVPGTWLQIQVLVNLSLIENPLPLFPTDLNPTYPSASTSPTPIPYSTSPKPKSQTPLHHSPPLQQQSHRSNKTPTTILYQLKPSVRAHVRIRFLKTFRPVGCNRLTTAWSAMHAFSEDFGVWVGGDKGRGGEEKHDVVAKF